MTPVLPHALGVAQRVAPGESVCGDAHVIVARADGALLVCVVDGLGHGPRAAEASAAFVDFVRRHPTLAPGALLEASHAALRGTRGAAASALLVSPGEVCFAGVGNVRLRVEARAPLHGLTTPGVLGARLPAVQERRGSLAPGDLLILFTDGLRAPLPLPPDHAARAPQALADELLARAHDGRDDATIVVLRLR